ncbi:MAG: EamA family transporter, partial [Candidatus Micrarchaeales archaeon]
MLPVAFVILITLAAAAIAATAQYIFKKSAKEFRLNISGIISTFKRRSTLFGLVMYLVSLIVYLYALYETPVVSFIYPVFASSLIFVLLISMYALKEKVNLHRVLGIILILLGIIIISFTL